MSSTDNLMLRFLREINSETVQEAFQSLDVLLDHLEKKDDPEPFEMHIVDSAYQALEKSLMHLKETNCKNFMIKLQRPLDRKFYSTKIEIKSKGLKSNG